MSSFAEQIISFRNSSEFKSLDAFYSRPSIFSALGVSRQENAHSNFLAWLLTPKPRKNDHGLGDTPLRKLLETIALVCRSLPHAMNRLAANISNAIIPGDYTLSNITVERERPIGDGRLDIYLEGNITFDAMEHPLQLVIENKVKSSEHDNQLARYKAALCDSRTRSGVYLDIFLTPLNNREYESLDKPRHEVAEFIPLNYQYLADYVIAPCRDQAAVDAIRQYLDEYLLALGTPELQQNKGAIIMAINGEERDLLSRFWDTHKELLIAAILSISDSDILGDAEYEIIKNASQVLANARRDTTRYTWELEGALGENLPKSRLVLDIIKHYADKHPGVSLKDLQEAFPSKLQGRNFSVITPLADASDFKGHKRYFTDDPIDLNDGPAAVCNQWRLDNIDAFIDCAKELGYQIKIADSTE
jgi:hypothetical protein